MFEYKVVPAPLRAKRIKSAKGPQARFAGTIEQELNALAADGWEYLRSETLPAEERSALGKIKSDFKTVLVFRRDLNVDALSLRERGLMPQPELTASPIPDDDEPVTPAATVPFAASPARTLPEPPLSEPPLTQKPLTPPTGLDPQDRPASDDFPDHEQNGEKQRD